MDGSSRYDLAVVFGILIVFALIPELLGKKVVKTLLDWVFLTAYSFLVFATGWLYHLQFTGQERQDVSWILAVGLPLTFIIVFVYCRNKLNKSRPKVE